MKITEKDLARLLSVPLFAGLPPELLRAAAEKSGGVCELPPGELLLSPETEGSTAAVLLGGRATVTTPDSGHALLLRFLAPGDVFGVANLFSGEPFVSIIRAETVCRCCYFSQEAISELLDVSRVFRESYIGFLSGRIRYLNRKIGYLTAGGAERRLALYLSSLGECEIKLQDSITSLSELLNLGRASLYRAFDRLCEDGYLIKNGRTLTVPDPEALKNAYR